MNLKADQIANPADLGNDSNDPMSGAPPSMIQWDLALAFLSLASSFPLNSLNFTLRPNYKSQTLRPQIWAREVAVLSPELQW